MSAARPLGASSPLGFALASLATWRLSHLLAEEDGPGEIVIRIRGVLGDALLGSLVDCFYCLTIWIAAPLAARLVRRPREFPVAWLAVSGAACLLERATAEPCLAGANDDTKGVGHVLWAEAQGTQAQA